jgi:ubiquinone/menaquinone biosynthesis C-methylase UbiE
MFGWFKSSKAGGRDAAFQASHPMLDLALEQLAVKKDDVVLDVGFGDGEALRRLVPLVKNGRLAGLETNQGALEKAARDFSEEFTHFRVDFKNAVVFKIPFYDGSFTKVLSLDQMHTWINVDKAFDEISRVLAPGGLFVLVWGVPVDPDTNIGRRILLPEEIEKLLKSAGFYHPALRERVEGELRYYQYLSKKL